MSPTSTGSQLQRSSHTPRREPEPELWPKAIVLLWAGALLCTGAGELLPGDSAPIIALASTNVSDKLMHFGAYAIIAFVPAFGFRLRNAIRYIISTELAGIGLEIAQRFIPDRSSDLYDVLANTIGVLAGTALALAIRSELLLKIRGRHDDRQAHGLLQRPSETGLDRFRNTRE